MSGPILLLGAVAIALQGTGAINLGIHAINNTISITLVLALLTFVPEALLRNLTKPASAGFSET